MYSSESFLSNFPASPPEQVTVLLKRSLQQSGTSRFHRPPCRKARNGVISKVSYSKDIGRKQQFWFQLYLPFQPFSTVYLSEISDLGPTRFVTFDSGHLSTSHEHPVICFLRVYVSVCLGYTCGFWHIFFFSIYSFIQYTMHICLIFPPGVSCIRRSAVLE